MICQSYFSATRVLSPQLWRTKPAQPAKKIATENVVIAHQNKRMTGGIKFLTVRLEPCGCNMREYQCLSRSSCQFLLRSAYIPSRALSRSVRIARPFEFILNMNQNMSVRARPARSSETARPNTSAGPNDERNA